MPTPELPARRVYLRSIAKRAKDTASSPKSFEPKGGRIIRRATESAALTTLLLKVTFQ
jgi:hypothetical protein